MQKIKKNINFLQLVKQKVGDERRLETLKNILDSGTFLPRTLEYDDIDKEFKAWVESLEITDDNGNAYPTMSLFSNQRFSEYSQAWKYTDKNKNLLLNFKTITRDNNPENGKIQGGLWNIPGDKFYTMKKKRVLDDNGSESLLILKMKQPVAIDFMFKVSIFTTRFTDINEFNTLINKQFAARQAYICPNGHYLPMTLESINDSSSYNIDDRQFYAQTYQIKVMAYIITKDDYRMDEIPLKTNISIPQIDGTKADVEMDEPENEAYDNYQKAILTVEFPLSTNKVSFTLDTDFVIKEIESLNVVNDSLRIDANDEPQNNTAPLILFENSKIKMSIRKRISRRTAKITFIGYNPNFLSENEVSDKIIANE